MKKSKRCLNHETLLLLADFLDEGHSLKEALTFLESCNKSKTLSFVQTKLNEGYSFKETLSFLTANKDWLEYFSFISQYATLSQAIRGACHLTEMKGRLAAILRKQLTYPFCLVAVMVLFSLFFEGMIFPQMQALSASFASSEFKPGFWFVLFLKIPAFGLAILMVILILSADIALKIKQRNFRKLFVILNIPFFSNLLKYYYSLKFASFYAVLSQYVSGLRDSVFLMYEKMADSDLMVVIYLLKNGLENGRSFEQCISQIPFFHESLIRYIQMFLRQGKPLTSLTYYAEQCEQVLEKRMKHLSQVLMISIYGFTAVYIVVLYLMLLLPMLEMASQI